MKERVSPEEKLLRLIRKDKKPAPAGGVAATVIKQPAAPLTLDSGTAFLASAPVQKVLIGCVVAACLYWGGTLLYPLVIPEAEIVPVKTASTQPDLPAPQPLEEYISAFQGRPVFESGLGAGEQKVGQSQPAFDPELVKGLSLLAIMSGDNPQAVIEDSRVQKTYYLSRGQTVNGLKVEEIKDGRVTLSAGGQTFELNL